MNANVIHTDIKPNQDPTLATRYLDVPKMDWEPTNFPGVQIKVLYADDEGMTTALFKLEPGAIVPMHVHMAIEQTYVLEGTLEDHEGDAGAACRFHHARGGQRLWRDGRLSQAIRRGSLPRALLRRIPGGRH